MACPDCGSPLGEFKSAISIETHGLGCGPFERFEDEYIVCRECGGQFDVSDWDSSDSTELHGTGSRRLPQEEIHTWPD